MGSGDRREPHRRRGEWSGFALAYAYGQTVPAEEFEDLLEFRKFYRAELAEEREDGARKV